MQMLENWYMMFRFTFFFFSSGRRHTSCGRDWSSDVCSSDLDVGSVPDSPAEPALPEAAAGQAETTARSEERRAGKECRSRGAPYHSKKKRAKQSAQRAAHARPLVDDLDELAQHAC